MHRRRGRLLRSWKHPILPRVLDWGARAQIRLQLASMRCRTTRLLRRKRKGDIIHFALPRPGRRRPSRSSPVVTRHGRRREGSTKRMNQQALRQSRALCPRRPFSLCGQWRHPTIFYDGFARRSASSVRFKPALPRNMTTTKLHSPLFVNFNNRVQTRLWLSVNRAPSSRTCKRRTTPCPLNSRHSKPVMKR